MRALDHGSAGPPFQTAGLPLRVRRSAVACITCRRRKIRCDVTVSGTPCINCRLDNDQCVTVNPKRPRKTKNAGAVLSLRGSQPLASLPLVTNNARGPPVIDSPASSQRDDATRNAWPPLLADTGRLPPNDIAYLTSQQALTLPKKAIIHTLLQCYFLHVHPCFPVVKESEFRDGSLHQKPFSLLVFRSMLFAAACVQCLHISGQLEFIADPNCIAHSCAVRPGCRLCLRCGPEVLAL